MPSTRWSISAAAFGVYGTAVLACAWLGIASLADLHWLAVAWALFALVVLRLTPPLGALAAFGAYAGLNAPVWLALLVFLPAMAVPPSSFRRFHVLVDRDGTSVSSPAQAKQADEYRHRSGSRPRGRHLDALSHNENKNRF